MNKILLIFAIMISGCNMAFATTCTIPTIYATNGQVTSVNLNGNFAACQGTVNGNLDNTNANTSAGYRFYQTVSSLPSAGNQGAVYYLTSDNSLNFDTGSTFIKTIAPSGSPSQGNVLIYGGSGLTYTGVGTTGQPLISNGAGANAGFGNITAASSVSGAALTSLSSTSVGAGIFPKANIGGLLGTWTTCSSNTIYQASTDGLFMAYVGSTQGDGMSLLSDGNSTPSTIRARSGGSSSGLMSPVRKNDYYEASGDLGITFTYCYFISIGS